jgi:hypothetical protein
VSGEGEAARNGPSVVVRTRGLSASDRRVLRLSLSCSPVVLLLMFLELPPFPQDLPQKLGSAVGVVAAAILLTEGLTSVRQVDIDERGVRFQYPFHKEFGSWEKLSYYPTYLEPNVWVISRARQGRRVSVRGHRVTKDQARAIVSYPSCPKWNLSPEVRQSLGLDLSPPVPPQRNP